MDRILHHRNDRAGVLQACVGHGLQNQRRAAAGQILYRAEAAGMLRTGGSGGAAVCCAGAVIGDGKPGIERLAGDFTRDRVAAQMRYNLFTPSASVQSIERHDKNQSRHQVNKRHGLDVRDAEACSHC